MASGRKGPRALAESVSKVTQPIFARKGFADGAIVADWSAIVGDRLAGHSAPEKVDFPRGDRTDGTLTLRVDASGLATELQHLAPQLIERINGFFGYAAISRLRFVHGPLPERPAASRRQRSAPSQVTIDAAAESVAAVEDDSLREALDRLGRSVLADADDDTSRDREP